eukprot:3407185-Ditylum_brightwellii.AAC.1
MDGKIFVIGGKDDRNQELSSIEVFTAATKEWSFLPYMGTKYSGCAAVGMEGELFVIGGEDKMEEVLSSVCFPPPCKQRKFKVPVYFLALISCLGIPPSKSIILDSLM